MKLLLDTHALLWWFSDDPALSKDVQSLIDDQANSILVSAASAWAICTKVRIGKLPTGAALCEDFSGYLTRFHFEPLPISVEHARRAGRFSGIHKDPFDRILAAQAQLERLQLVSNDQALAAFGVSVIW